MAGMTPSSCLVAVMVIVITMLGTTSGFLGAYPTAMKKAAFEDIITQYYAYDPFLNNPNRKGRDHLMEDSAQAGNSKFIRPFVQPLDPIRHLQLESNNKPAEQKSKQQQGILREPSEPAKFIRPEFESTDNNNQFRVPIDEPRKNGAELPSAADGQQDGFVPIAPEPGKLFALDLESHQFPESAFESSKLLPSAEPLRQYQPEKEATPFRQLASSSLPEPDPEHQFLHQPDKSARPSSQQAAPVGNRQPAKNIRPLPSKAVPESSPELALFRHNVEPAPANSFRQQPQKTEEQPPIISKSIEPAEAIQFRPILQLAEPPAPPAKSTSGSITTSSSSGSGTTYQYHHFPGSASIPPSAFVPTSGRPPVDPSRPYLEDYHHHDPALFAIPVNSGSKDPFENDYALRSAPAYAPPPAKRFADPVNAVQAEPPEEFLKSIFPNSPVSFDDFRGFQDEEPAAPRYYSASVEDKRELGYEEEEEKKMMREDHPADEGDESDPYYGEIPQFPSAAPTYGSRQRGSVGDHPLFYDSSATFRPRQVHYSRQVRDKEYVVRPSVHYYDDNLDMPSSQGYSIASKVLWRTPYPSADEEPHRHRPTVYAE